MQFHQLKTVLSYSLRTKSVQKRTSTRTMRTLLSVQRVYFIKKNIYNYSFYIFFEKKCLEINYNQ
jgi:hypothetical protein